jgi:hypothetical protein
MPSIIIVLLHSLDLSYMLRKFSEPPEVNWDSCGYDACHGAGNAAVHYI